MTFRLTLALACLLLAIAMTYGARSQVYDGNAGAARTYDGPTTYMPPHPASHGPTEAYCHSHPRSHACKVKRQHEREMQRRAEKRKPQHEEQQQ